MGLFGNATDSAIAEEVERATSDKLVEEDWQIIMNICDKAGKSGDDAKTWLKAIVKRLFNSDPHVGLKAVTLLDACVKNSGKIFHIEVASRDFENDFTKLMTKADPHVAKKLREALKRWADTEFKSDGQLSLIPSLYNKLINSYDFSTPDTPVKKRTSKTTDPNVVESQEEEEQILKAIELSLKETTGSPKKPLTTSAVQPASSSLYPSVNSISTATAIAAAPGKEARKVRALYDFEAAEDNELTFNAGEIIMVLDDSDPNWWKGSNQRGDGLFPANFVTADLSVEPEKFLFEKAKKTVQFKEEVKVVEKDPEEIEINENKINRLLHLLHEADPTNPETDTDELLSLEREVNAMGPLIDAELERVDQKHAQLTQLSADLVEALGLYHTLMREPQPPAALAKMCYEPQYAYPSPQFNGSLPPMMHIPPHMFQLPPGLPQQSLQHESLPYQPSMQYQMQHQLPPAGQMHPPIMPQPQQQSMPHTFSQMVDDRAGPVFHQGMPQPAFSSNGPFSQTNLQAPPGQQPNYVTSSTHMMQ
ncbi:signal transducing adapter molecule 1 [Euwallacea fornicatus]|uniref:signal transducing adapter molecule 1 n=1 Tax=Euwallacea fornicatus TaxID=995702 RepID=UPI00338F54CA